MKPVIFLDIDDVLCLRYEGPDSHARTLDGMLWETGDDPTALAALPESEIWTRVFDANARANLSRLHAAVGPDVRYVISSSWAEIFSRTQICEVFRRTGLQFVVDNLHRGTPDSWATPRGKEVARNGFPSSAIRGFSTRSEEIACWLRMEAARSGNKPPYVILDDEVSGGSLRTGAHRGRVVMCARGEGFRRKELEQAVKALGACVKHDVGHVLDSPLHELRYSGEGAEDGEGVGYRKSPRALRL
jgi:hypothetical protein